jgi:DNA (cytosine-5)-methyltransferase 1
MAGSPRVGSLCSGYAGLDLAVREVIGGELAFVADNDPGAAATLAYHYPSVKNLGDITGVDWGSVEPVEVLAGGFPCQDVSAAGARAGLKHGNRSGLWHEFVKAIAAHRPQLVVIENVLGLLTARGDEPTAEHLAAEAGRDTLTRLLGWPENELALAVSRGDKGRARVCRARIARLRKLHKQATGKCQWHEQRLIRAIGTVLASLAGLGYDAEWVVVTAAAAGACHRRARLFILAFPTETRTVPVPGDPVAVITDGVWLDPLENLFGSAPYTGRVPASGRMAGGRVYAAEPGPTTMAAGLLPTPAAMDARVGDMNISPEAVELQLRRNDPDGSRRNTTGSLTKDLLLLKTPTAQLAVNGGSQHPDKRRAGGHGPTLADQVEHELLPTPTARENGGSNGRHGDATRGDDLPEAVRYLPTPNATDWKGSGAAVGRMRDGRPRTAGDADLTEAVAQLLPTPAARDGKGRDMPGREGGRSLPDTLLPTPRATDGTKGGPNQRGSSGDLMLPSAVMSLLPTPTAADGDRTSSVYPRGDATLLGALLPTPQATDGQGGPRAVPGKRTSNGPDHGPRLRDVAPALLPTPSVTNSHGNDRRGDGSLLLPGVAKELGEAMLLPTPSVADGTGGHTSRSGPRKGEALLGGIGMLLPTPTTTDAKGARNATANRSEAKAGVNNDGWTLSDVLWTGDLPAGADTGRLLPTPAAGNFNDGESAERWQARKDFHAGKEADATRAGMPLTVAAQLAGVDWGPYEAAIRRWEAVTGRQAPPPTVPGRTGERLNPALPEWMMGLPEGWITGVPGLSRNSMLKLAGNGCVPQQVALALRILLGRAGAGWARERAA